MSQIKVEIGNFKEVDKGSLRAFFSVVIYPEGQKIIDCRYFEQEDKRWIAFPQKVVTHQDGRKPDYIPYISYSNKVYQEELKTTILAAIKETKQKVQHVEQQSNGNAEQAHPVQGDASTRWY